MEINENDLDLMNIDELIAKPEYQEALNKIREERKNSFKNYEYKRNDESEAKININRIYEEDDDVGNNENKKEGKKEKKKKKRKKSENDKPKKKNTKKKAE